MANFFLIIKYLNTVSLAYLIDRQIYWYYGVLKGIISDRIVNFKASFVTLRRLSVNH